MSIFVAWYLIVFGVVHLIGAVAGPELGWRWTGLLLGAAELVLGIWAAHCWQRSLVTLVTLVGVWAVVHGVNEIFAAFAVSEIGSGVEHICWLGEVRALVVVWFTAWIGLRVEQYPFGLLTMIVSLERSSFPRS